MSASGFSAPAPGTLTRYEGELTPLEGRFALIAARFNDLVVDRLIGGAQEALRQHGIGPERIDLVRVPGAWEIPLAALHLARSGRYAALICLGCVLRGQTDHYEYVASAAAQGIARIALDRGIPIGFGVLTCETLEQALDRAGGKAGNKGAEAALAALEMVHLLQRLPFPAPASSPSAGGTR